MREEFHKFALPDEDPHTVLREWGKPIKAKFDLDNIHLSLRKDHPQTSQLVDAMQGLGSQLGRMHNLLAKLGDRVKELENKMCNNMPQGERELSTPQGTPAANKNLGRQTPPSAGTLFGNTTFGDNTTFADKDAVPADLGHMGKSFKADSATNDDADAEDESQEALPENVQAAADAEASRQN